MNEKIIELFSDSYERCCAQSVFMDLFYQYFISSSDEIQAKFQITNMERQKRMMLSSLGLAMQAYLTPDRLSHIAKTHSQSQYDIEAHLYDNWLEALIDAAKDVDEFFNSDIENAWREVMRPCIEYMIKHYK